MKPFYVLAFMFGLFACQPKILPTVTIIDNEKIVTLQTDERIPAALLKQAGITLRPNDRVLLNGLPVGLDQAITDEPVTLQIRRPINFAVLTSDEEKKLQSTAFTLGEALLDASVWLHANDKIAPQLNSPIRNG